MNPTIYANHEEMSRAAADWLLNRIQRKLKPSSLICLATGATPMRCYELLSQEPKETFAGVQILKLDEWGGIPMSSPATCETFLRKSLVDPLDLQSRYYGFESQPADPAAECKRVSDWLAANGPIDYCVLGLGVNGHLGFNEPAEFLTPHAHVATLSAESLTHSMLAGLKQRPTYGLTLGIADLLASREILLVVSGESKAAPMRRLLTPEISTHFPASFLWLRPRVTILCDRAAAQDLS